MMTTKTKIALGLATAVLMGPLFAATAGAGDYNGGGLKGLRGSYVPVPAPAPIPDYKPKWYLRGDVGLGMNLGVKTSESGMTWGDRNNPEAGGRHAQNPFEFGGLPFSSTGSAASDEVGHSVGIGAGYYFSPNFRMDLTGELRMMKTSTLNGEFRYESWNDDLTLPGAPPGSGSWTGEDVLGTVTDRTTMRSGILMANAYFDMNSMGGWKPYIGGGLGVSVNEIKRTHTTDYRICNPAADAACIDAVDAGSLTATTGTQYTYSLAAALTAGVSYRVSDVTSLDFNYRYLYVGGTDTSMSINGSVSNLNIADQHEHYLRAGLRWDIN